MSDELKTLKEENTLLKSRMNILNDRYAWAKIFSEEEITEIISIKIGSSLMEELFIRTGGDDDLFELESYKVINDASQFISLLDYFESEDANEEDLIDDDGEPITSEDVLNEMINSPTLKQILSLGLRTKFCFSKGVHHFLDIANSKYDFKSIGDSHEPFI